MAHVLGYNAKLYRNTDDYDSPAWDEVTNVRDVTLNLEAGEADVTVRGGDGWRQTVPTLKDLSLEFEMIWDTSDADFTAIQAAFLAGSSLEFVALDGAVDEAGNEGIRATFMVGSFTRNESLEEALTVSVTLKATRSDNAPEWYTSTT